MKAWDREWMAAYADGELGPFLRWVVRRRLMRSPEALAQYERREEVRGLLRDLPSPKAPRILRTRILLAASRNDPDAMWSRLKVRLRNAMRPLAIPATGGVVSAVVLFVSLMSNIWFAPRNWPEDVPLRYLAETFVSNPKISVPSPFGVTKQVGVLALIDREGKVYDFRMVALPSADPGVNTELRAQLANALLTAQFAPATSFGQPVPGQVFISFRPVEQVDVVGS